MTQLRILVVDDTPHVRRMLATMLEDDGHLIVGAASSAVEAAELNRTEHPDVVVLDHRMPGMGGLEVAEEILSIEPRPSVIVYSAFVEPGVEEAAAALGVTVCLAKADGLGPLAAELDRIARRRAV